MAAPKKYGLWTQENMERALYSLRNGDAGINEICRTYGIPKPTLKRRLEDKNKKACEGLKSFGRGTDLPNELEEELVRHVLLLESHMFGCTRKDLQKLAFDLAEANGVKHRFKNGTAGKQWYYSFMARHPTLSLRQPEATSAARAFGFNKEAVNKFFDILTDIVDRNGFQATQIFNMDETSLSTVQKPQKIIAAKGKHQVGAITSGERGTNTTCVCCFSASGLYVPPMLVFKRKRFSDDLKPGAPPGTQFAVSDSGWMTSELFIQWMQHFIQTVRPCLERKVLLILDGHVTHTRNLDAINLARDNGVIMLCLPPHTTHRLQPLDVAFFKPLGTYYNQAADKWLRTNPGSNITLTRIAGLLGEAYGRAATVQNAVSGFSKTGIWPVDPNVFQDSDFVATIGREVPEGDEGLEFGQIEGPAVLPRCCSPPPPNQPPKVSPHQLSPVPILQKRKRSRTSTTATVITGSPHKKLLLDSKTLGCSGKKAPKLPISSSSASWYCTICEENKEEDMIKCLKCSVWFHTRCANVTPKKKMFYCNLGVGAQDCNKTEELMRCINPMRVLNDDTVGFVMNKEELDKWCPDLNRGIRCIDSYTRRCMTEEKRIHFNQLYDGTTRVIRKLCLDDTYQQEFLSHAPCMRQVTSDYEQCAQKYQQKIGEVHHRINEQSKRPANETAAERSIRENELKTVCCSFRDYLLCSQTIVMEKCGEKTANFTKDFLNEMSVSLIQAHCRNYPLGSDQCQEASSAPTWLLPSPTFNLFLAMLSFYFYLRT